MRTEVCQISRGNEAGKKQLFYHVPTSTTSACSTYMRLDLQSKLLYETALNWLIQWVIIVYILKIMCGSRDKFIWGSCEYSNLRQGYYQIDPTWYRTARLVWIVYKPVIRLFWLSTIIEINNLEYSIVRGRCIFRHVVYLHHVVNEGFEAVPIKLVHWVAYASHQTGYWKHTRAWNNLLTIANDQLLTQLIY
jgi:hypothetical protein